MLRSVVALAGIVALASALPSGISAQTRMKKSEPDADLCADAAERRRQDARGRQGHQGRLRVRSRLRRRPHPDHGGDALRRARLRRRHQSQADRGGARQRQDGGRLRPGRVPPAGPVQDLGARRDGGRALSVRLGQREAASAPDQRAASRQPHRRARFPDRRRLEAGRRGGDREPHRLSLVRAGAGRRQLGDQPAARRRSPFNCSRSSR